MSGGSRTAGRHEPSLTVLVNSLIAQFKILVHQEARLFQAELGEKIARIQSGLLCLAIGLFGTFCALVTFILSAVAGLALVMPLWAAASLTGLIIALVSAVLLTAARNRLRVGSLALERTMRSIQGTTPPPDRNPAPGHGPSRQGERI